MRHKRKYNKSGKYSKQPTQDASQSTTDTSKDEISVIVPIDVLTAEYKGDTDIIWDGKLIAKAPDNLQDKIQSENIDIMHSKINHTKVYSLEKEVNKLSKKFTFKDLPLYIQNQIEKDILFRKRLNLFDDSKDRKERAVKYWRGGDANAK